MAGRTQQDAEQTESQRGERPIDDPQKIAHSEGAGEGDSSATKDVAQGEPGPDAA